MKILTFFFFAFLVMSSTAQSELLIQPEDVIAEATRQLENAMQTEGIIKTWASEKAITGTYEYELTIGKAARIVSVRILSSKEGNIPSQNAVKDFLIDKFRFEMKIPKDKKYKLNYTFSF